MHEVVARHRGHAFARMQGDFPAQFFDDNALFGSVGVRVPELMHATGPGEQALDIAGARWEQAFGNFKADGFNGDCRMGVLLPFVVDHFGFEDVPGDSGSPRDRLVCGAGPEDVKKAVSCSEGSGLLVV